MSGRAGGFGITNIEQLPFSTRTAFEELIVQIQAWTDQEHYGDGSHKDITVDSVSSPPEASANDAAVEILAEDHGHLWTRGPWLFSGAASLRPPETSGTLNDWAPQGIDSAIVVELEPGSSSTITITGIKPASAHRRPLILGNRDSGGGLIVIKHQDTGSGEFARFRLPGNADVTLASGEYAWLFYDTDAGRWRMFVTGQAAGGIAEAGGFTPTTQDLRVASITLADADIKTLSSVPVNTVAAPGSGFVVMPVMFSIQKNFAAGAYGSNPNIFLRWAGVALDLTTAISLTFTAADSRISAAVNSFAATTSSADNKALVVRSTADVTGGNAANTLKVSVVYYLMPV